MDTGYLSRSDFDLYLFQLTARRHWHWVQRSCLPRPHKCQHNRQPWILNVPMCQASDQRRQLARMGSSLRYGEWHLRRAKRFEVEATVGIWLRGRKQMRAPHGRASEGFGQHCHLSTQRGTQLFRHALQQHRMEARIDFSSYTREHMPSMGKSHSAPWMMHVPHTELHLLALSIESSRSAAVIQV